MEEETKLESEQNPYSSPEALTGFVAARSSVIVSVLLISGNVLYHVLLLAWVRSEDSFIEFRTWFDVIACYVPVIVTIVIAVLCRCRLFLASVLIGVSILFAVLHGILLNLAAAIV